MDASELKILWSVAGNPLAVERARGFAAAAEIQLARGRRQRKGLLIWAISALGVSTVFGEWTMWRHGTGTSDIWYARAIMAAAWIGVYGLWRLFRAAPKPATPAAAASPSIRDAMERLVTDARLKCRERQVLLALYVAMGPLLALAIQALRESGKMRPHEAQSAAWLGGVVLGGFALGFLSDLLFKKLPEKRRLEALLREYETPKPEAR